MSLLYSLKLPVLFQVKPVVDWIYGKIHEFVTECPCTYLPKLVSRKYNFKVIYTSPLQKVDPIYDLNREVMKMLCATYCL